MFDHFLVYFVVLANVFYFAYETITQTVVSNLYSLKIILNKYYFLDKIVLHQYNGLPSLSRRVQSPLLVTDDKETRTDSVSPVVACAEDHGRCPEAPRRPTFSPAHGGYPSPGPDCRG